MWPLLHCNCHLQLLNPWYNIVVMRTKSAKGKDCSHLARHPSYRHLTRASNCTDQGAWSSFENSMGTCFVYITMETDTQQACLRRSVHRLQLDKAHLPVVRGQLGAYEHTDLKYAFVTYNHTSTKRVGNRILTSINHTASPWEDQTWLEVNTH